MKNQENLLKKLQAYTPINALDLENKLQMIQLLVDYPLDCFHRSCLPAHFTASAWILSPALDQVLLLHHAKLNIWVQPGGHCDAGDCLLSEALREAQEETGLLFLKPLMTSIFDIDIHRIPARGKEPAHKHFDVRFLIQLTQESPLRGNGESLSLGWFPLVRDRLPTSESSIIRMLDKTLQWKTCHL